MEAVYSRFGNEHLSLEERTKDAAERGCIGEILYYDLFNAKRDDLTWDTFYNLLEMPEEKEKGYWLASKIASTLLGPTISNQFYKNQNARISERMEDDFLSEVIMEIARVIPNYSREKSEFPNFIRLYIKQCGYVHNKDYSVYLQKKKGIRIFSQGNLTDNKEEQTSKDSFEKIASSITIEDIIEQKEERRKNAVFTNVVIQKVFSNQEDRSTHSNAQKLLSLRDEARLLRMTDRDNKSNENEKRIKSIEKMLEHPTSKNTIESDTDKTIVNACLWKKFLGGVDSYGSMFLDKVADEIERERD